ncbi:MAG: hypothetical protein B7Z45_00480 [Azorhizobium sp. 12-66-6]|nr:MAG: hypothetical protein B7Z45_00480 [Azorhizobium sp. 12-66-6]
MRPLMGNRIYGCDDCLAACPWNKFAQEGRDMKLAARAENRAPALADLVALDDDAFRARFARSPIKRTGRVRMVRNVLIAMGNSDQPGFLPQILPLLEDEAPLVRGAAVWALSRLMPAADFARIAARRVPDPDGDVRAEWDAALS